MLTITVDLYSDVICPWCYIGSRHLRRAQELLQDRARLQIRWRPFELDPDMPVEGMEKREWMMRKFGGSDRLRDAESRVTTLGQGAGITFNFEVQERLPNTRTLHRLLWAIAETGQQSDLSWALFAAHFERGENLCDRDVVRAIARSVGVSDEVSTSVFEGNAGDREVDAEEERAYRLGIRGVPFFVFQDRIAVSGAQPAEVLIGAAAEACPELDIRGLVGQHG